MEYQYEIVKGFYLIKALKIEGGKFVDAFVLVPKRLWENANNEKISKLYIENYAWCYENGLTPDFYKLQRYIIDKLGTRDIDRALERVKIYG